MKNAFSLVQGRRFFMASVKSPFSLIPAFAEMNVSSFPIAVLGQKIVDFSYPYVLSVITE
jgi:hypothetical protein